MLEPFLQHICVKCGSRGDDMLRQSQASQAHAELMNVCEVMQASFDRQELCKALAAYLMSR
jgi:formylmethanofuran dehydrogenase subunit B